ncbi:MAG: glutathione S-transferase family protein [Sinobacteraceae bacterium]|nr:glutathione S-transferase family protein [Nevskiaceae bacterium]
MALIIHAFPPSPRSFKVLLAAQHLGLDYQLRFVNLLAGEQRSDATMKLNVNQRMPVLEDGDYVLWESNAMLEYLASLHPTANLLPQEVRARLQVTKWLYWESAHWDPACAILIFERVVKGRFNLGDENPAEIERGSKLLMRIAQVLDGELQKRPYVAGGQLSVADFALAAPLCLADAGRLPLSEYPGISDWRARITALPAWSSTLALQQSALQRMQSAAAAA